MAKRWVNDELVDLLTFMLDSRTIDRKLLKPFNLRSEVTLNYWMIVERLTVRFPFVKLFLY